MSHPNLFDAPGAVRSDAVISPCGRYRYTLTRRWGEGAPLLFVMLNPSTADASVDDPTIRRCLGFARREGFQALEVVNLFAFRATDPAELVTAVCPIGPDNTRHLIEARRRAGLVVAAWGAFVPRAYRDRPQDVINVLACGLLCLGMTAKGEPRHPLFVRGDAPLVPFVARPS